MPEDVHCADYSRDGDDDIMRSYYREYVVGAVAVSRTNPWAIVGLVWASDMDVWDLPKICAQVGFSPFLDAEHPDVIIGAPEPLREQAGFVAVYPWQLP